MRSAPVVVVVEDNAELRHVLKEALGSEGYQVLATRDEVEAMEILRSEHVDLVISDLTDPSSAQAALRSVQVEFPELPVVALTETARHHPAPFQAASGTPGHVRTVPKPFRLGELLEASREALDPSHRRPLR